MTTETALARTQEAPRFEPAVDVYENAESLLMLVDLPGVAKEALSVEVKDGALALQAERGAEARYARSFRLPDTVDQAKISVTLQAGVARIELPKHERAKPQRIPVN